MSLALKSIEQIPYLSIRSHTYLSVTTQLMAIYYYSTVTDFAKLRG